MTHVSRILATAAIAFTVGPAAADAAPANPAAARSAAMVDAVNSFGLALFGELAQGAAPQNLLLSPLGVATVLTMVAQGAVGDTRAAFHATLRLGGMSVADTAAALRRLRGTLHDNAAGVRFDGADAVWADDALAIAPAFQASIENHFGASIERVSFAHPGAVGKVNGWVADRTEGMIPAIVDRLSPETALVLVDALYFDGVWATAFDPERTVERPFTRADGSTVDTPTMSRKGAMAYLETDAFQAVALPYGDGAFEMVVALPRAATAPIAEWLEHAGSSWLSAELREQPGVLALPRFAIEYGAELNGPLEAIGLERVFAGAGDLSGIAASSPNLDQVLHRAAMRVDERGTEAAAAAAVVTTRSFQPEGFSMVVDRPFALALRHAATGLVVFLGLVGDPARAG
jgi:serpin B